MRDEEVTRRTRLISEVEAHEQSIKRIRFWLEVLGGAALAVFLAGIAAARLHAGLARAEDVQRLQVWQAVADERMTDVQAGLRRQDEQLREIARAVRATIIVQPQQEQK